MPHENLLLPKPRSNNNTNCSSTVHEFDAFSSGVKPAIFAEDLAGMDHFDAVLIVLWMLLLLGPVGTHMK
jgi:hypothetical protein